MFLFLTDWSPCSFTHQLSMHTSRHSSQKGDKHTHHTHTHTPPPPPSLQHINTHSSPKHTHTHTHTHRTLYVGSVTVCCSLYLLCQVAAMLKSPSRLTPTALVCLLLAGLFGGGSLWMLLTHYCWLCVKFGAWSMQVGCPGCDQCHVSKPPLLSGCLVLWC